jgi:hypothetical protein
VKNSWFDLLLIEDDGNLYSYRSNNTPSAMATSMQFKQYQQADRDREVKPMKVNRLTFVITMIALLTGCVSSQIIPPQQVVSEIRYIRVVALESPPLEVPSQMKMFAPQIPGAFLISNILVLSQIPTAASAAAGPMGQESELRSKILNNQGLWEPTVVLSEEVENQLSAAGRPVVRSPKIQPIPGITERDYTYFGENWLAPIRQWYNAEKSIYNYVAHQVSGNESIIEVALINYSVGIDDHLLLQVMVKLVDPLTGKTIGKARASANPHLAAKTAFRDNGKIFKQVFRETGSDLVHQCLKKLGLASGS